MGIRLHDIAGDMFVICGNAVAIASRSRQYEYDGALQRRTTPNLANQAQPVESWHANVDEQQVWRLQFSLPFLPRSKSIASTPSRTRTNGLTILAPARPRTTVAASMSSSSARRIVTADGFISPSLMAGGSRPVEPYRSATATRL